MLMFVNRFPQGNWINTFIGKRKEGEFSFKQGVWVFKILSCQTGAKTLFIHGQVDCKVVYLYFISGMYDMECRFSVTFEESWGHRRAAVEGMKLGETACRWLFPLFQVWVEESKAMWGTLCFPGGRNLSAKEEQFLRTRSWLPGKGARIWTRIFSSHRSNRLTSNPGYFGLQNDFIWMHWHCVDTI